jgi:hypothetical protein
MSKLVAALLIATETVGFLYALAVVVVFTLVATSRAEDTPLDQASAERHAAAEYQAARAQCETLFAGRQRAICIADAHAAEKEARIAAQYGRHGSSANSRMARTDANLTATR